MTYPYTDAAYRTPGAQYHRAPTNRSRGPYRRSSPGQPLDFSDPRHMIPVIRAAAIANGINPDLAVRVAASEGLANFYGDHGKSGGAFQLYTGGGLGNEYYKETGRNPLDPRNEIDATFWAMNQARLHGWGPWHGARRIGVTGNMGMGPVPQGGGIKSAYDPRGWQMLQQMGYAPSEAGAPGQTPQGGNPNINNASYTPGYGGNPMIELAAFHPGGGGRHGGFGFHGGGGGFRGIPPMMRHDLGRSMFPPGGGGYRPPPGYGPQPRRYQEPPGMRPQILGPGEYMPPPINTRPWARGAGPHALPPQYGPGQGGDGQGGQGGQGGDGGYQPYLPPTQPQPGAAPQAPAPAPPTGGGATNNPPDQTVPPPGTQYTPPQGGNLVTGLPDPSGGPIDLPQPNIPPLDFSQGQGRPGDPNGPSTSDPAPPVMPNQSPYRDVSYTPPPNGSQSGSAGDYIEPPSTEPPGGSQPSATASAPPQPALSPPVDSGSPSGGYQSNAVDVAPPQTDQAQPAQPQQQAPVTLESPFKPLDAPKETELTLDPVDVKAPAPKGQQPSQQSSPARQAQQQPADDDDVIKASFDPGGPVQLTSATIPAAAQTPTGGAPGSGAPPSSAAGGPGGQTGGAAVAPVQPEQPQPAQTEQQPQQAKQPAQPAPPSPQTAYPPIGQDAYNGIATVEKTRDANGNIRWNAVGDTGQEQPLENMTVGQVAGIEGPDDLDFGGMQINRHSLVSAATALGMDPNKQRFDRATQQRMADYLWHTEGPGYWRGFDSDNRSLQAAQGLTFGRIKAGQEFLTDTQKRYEEAKEASAALQKRVDQQIAKGEYDTSEYRKTLRESIQAEKRAIHLYDVIRANPPQRDPNAVAEAIGSMTGALGMIGGFGNLPASVAMGAMAAAINARVDGNEENFRDNMEKWKTAATMAGNLIHAESQLGVDTIRAMEGNAKGLQDELTPYLLKFNNLSALQLLNNQQYEAIDKQFERLAQIAESWPITNKIAQLQQEALMGYERDINQWKADHAAEFVANGNRVDPQFQAEAMRRNFQPLMTFESIVNPPAKGAGSTAVENFLVPDPANPGEMKTITGRPDPSGIGVRELDGTYYPNAQKAPPRASGENFTEAKPFDIQNVETGETVRQGVLLKQRKDKPGFFDAQTGEPVKLGPHEQVVGRETAGGGRAGSLATRQLTGGREVLSDLQNAIEMNVGSVPAGLFSRYEPGVSIMGALEGDLIRKLTPDDALMMQASLANIGREIGTLLNPIGGGEWAAKQFNPLLPAAGESIRVTLFKLARLAQTADNALESLEHSNIIAPAQRKWAAQLRRDIHNSISFSPHDILAWERQGKKSETFGDYIKQQGLNTPSGVPKGSKYLGKEQGTNNDIWLDPDGHTKYRAAPDAGQ